MGNRLEGSFNNLWSCCGETVSLNRLSDLILFLGALGIGRGGQTAAPPLDSDPDIISVKSARRLDLFGGKNKQPLLKKAALPSRRGISFHTGITAAGRDEGRGVPRGFLFKAKGC